MPLQNGVPVGRKVYTCYDFEIFAEMSRITEAKIIRDILHSVTNNQSFFPGFRDHPVFNILAGCPTGDIFNDRI